MKTSILIICILTSPLFIYGQIPTIQLYTNNSTNVLQKDKVLVCDNFDGLSAIVQMTAEVMKFDMIRVDVEATYTEDYLDYSEGQSVDLAWGLELDLKTDYYKKKYGDAKTQTWVIIPSKGSSKTDLQYTVVDKYPYDADKFQNYACKYSTNKRKVYAVLYGFYIVDTKYVYNDGAGRMENVYDDGEVIAKSPEILIVLSEADEQKRMEEKLQKELDRQKGIADSRINMLESKYKTTVSTPAGDFPKTKKKHLYNAYTLVLQEQQAKISNQTVKEQINTHQFIAELANRMLTLFEEDTKALEKSLKNETNTASILQRLKLVQ